MILEEEENKVNIEMKIKELEKFQFIEFSLKPSLFF